MIPFWVHPVENTSLIKLKVLAMTLDFDTKLWTWKK